MRHFSSIACWIAIAALAACEVVDRPLERDADSVRGDALFSDVTAEWGIDFVHYSSASDRRLLPETMGAGVAVFDFDGDGLPDLYFVNGATLHPESRQRPTGALFRNLGHGRFEDVTAGSGLDVSFYGMGVAVGDYDNSGRPDLLVTAIDRNRLFRNLGGGRFEEVSDRVGGLGRGFSSSAAFIDYDNDGYLDLFIGRYVEWTHETDIPCSPDGIHPTYCTPEVYPPISNLLFRNHEGRYFEDVSEQAGIQPYLGKALGVVAFDYDRDGWPDIAVANDTTRNFLFINQRDGTFLETAEMAGMAYSESGATRGGMGIDAADTGRDGLPEIVIGNFSQEMVGFYRGTSTGFFIDEAAQAGIGIPSLMTLAFGTLIEDFNGDGWLDVMVVNGHIEPEISRTHRNQSYRQPPQFFVNQADGTFRLLEPPPGSALARPLVARGLASGDLSGNGQLDFVITQNGGPPVVLRNDHPVESWLQLALEGTRSNRTGWGTRVEITAGGQTWSRQLKSGRSYLSSSEPVLYFGLGSISSVERLEIFWPSGQRQIVESPELNRRHRIVEP